MPRDFIDSGEDVLVGSADIYVVSGLGEDMQARHPDCRRILSWSFARINEQARVIEGAEKKRISEYASTGLYYFTDGRQLVREGDQMVAARETAHDEYSVMPLYGRLLERGCRIDISFAEQVWDLGSPDSLTCFESQRRTT